MTRLPVSDTVKDLIAYTEAHQGEDRLVVGFTDNPKANPWRKPPCSVL